MSTNYFSVPRCSSGDKNSRTDQSLSLQARTVLVAGVFRAGSPTDKFASKFNLTLVNDDVPIARLDDLTEKLFVAPYGAKMLAVVESGVLDMHAVGRTPRWTRLDGSISVGATSLRLADNSDWQIG